MTDLPWAMDVIKALGIGGGPLFAVLWWLERKDRKACQEDGRELLVQSITVTGQSATALEHVSTAVANQGIATKEATASLAILIRSIRKGT